MTATENKEPILESALQNAGLLQGTQYLAMLLDEDLYRSNDNLNFQLNSFVNMYLLSNKSPNSLLSFFENDSCQFFLKKHQISSPEDTIPTLFHDKTFCKGSLLSKFTKVLCCKLQFL